MNAPTAKRSNSIEGAIVDVVERIIDECRTLISAYIGFYRL